MDFKKDRRFNVFSIIAFSIIIVSFNVLLSVCENTTNSIRIVVIVNILEIPIVVIDKDLWLLREV